MSNLLGPSWRTTLSGLAAIVTAAVSTLQALINNQPVDWNTTIAAVLAGIGLMSARDNKVSSEDVGVK